MLLSGLNGHTKPISELKELPTANLKVFPSAQTYHLLRLWPNCLNATLSTGLLLSNLNSNKLLLLHCTGPASSIYLSTSRGSVIGRSPIWMVMSISYSPSHMMSCDLTCSQRIAGDGFAAEPTDNKCLSGWFVVRIHLLSLSVKQCSVCVCVCL